MKKNRFKLASLTATLLAAAALNTNAQTWETILQLSNLNNSNSTFIGNDVMIDPFSPNPLLPDLFLGGGSSSGPVLHLDQSTAVVTASDEVYGRVQRLGSDAVGNLFSVGYVARSNKQNWQVRKSADQGFNWQVKDDAIQWNPNNLSVASGVAADPSGNIYVTGRSENKLGARYWTIRKGANHGESWTTVFTSSKAIAQGDGIQYLPPVPGKHAGGIFAVGRMTPRQLTEWTVLRSGDGGVSWQIVDAWVPAKNLAAAATAVASDGNGNLFVAGFGGAQPYGWYVRVSGDGGASWQTILNNYSVGTATSSIPHDMSVDASGNLYVVGETSSTDGSTWTVRRWDAAVQTWDQWPVALRHPLIPATRLFRALGVTTDATGRVYVTGSGRGAGSDYNQWVALRLSP